MGVRLALVAVKRGTHGLVTGGMLKAHQTGSHSRTTTAWRPRAPTSGAGAGFFGLVPCRTAHQRWAGNVKLKARRS